MVLKKYEFTCTFCGQPKVTFIPESYYPQIIHRLVDIKTVLPESSFSPTYTNFFTFGVCSECQADNLENFTGGKNFYDIDEGKDTTFIESNIIDMWENANRNK